MSSHPVRPLIYVTALALLLTPLATAQMIHTGNVHVYVTFPDDRAPEYQLKVELLGSGNDVAETFTNDHGQAQFADVEVGNYQVRVSGQQIKEAESELFSVDARKGTQTIFIRVRPINEASHNEAAGTVTAASLNIPRKARQELNKGTSSLAKQEWQKAIDHFQKALALYPKYAEAYTDLAVAYAKLNDDANERAALQKAVNADDHFAPAFVNLAAMEMRLHEFPSAQAHLEKAVSIEPTNVRSTVLLAQAELLNAKYEAVLETAHKVHEMSHASFARVHYVAARACEKLNRLPEAVKELQLFLHEEPSGPLTVAAAHELAVLQEHMQ